MSPRSNLKKEQRVRRFLRFGIRQLFILTALLSAFFAVVGWKIRRAHEVAESVASLKQLNAGLFFDYNYDPLDNAPNAEPGGPRWLKLILGDYFFAQVTEVFFYTSVDGVQTNLTDAHLEYFVPLTEVEKVSLAPGKITGSGLVHLTGADRLQVLRLDGNPLADSELMHIKRFQSLEELSLVDTPVTDNIVPYLEEISTLQLVDVTGTRMSVEGIQRLKQTLPDCDIIFGHSEL